jgi:DNA-binding response OmpR family regulator
MLDSPIAALLIEDDDRLARFTTDFLTQNGVVVTRAGDGEEGLTAALRKTYDVVILDLMLPRRDGLDVCKRLRARSNVPIVVVTARVDEVDRLLGFELGADDYLPKPFSPRELLARMRVHVRRARGQVGPDAAAHLLRVGDLELHPMSMRATLGGRDIELTSYEFALLRVLAERAGRALTREQLLELAKGGTEDSFERSIDIRISRLRQKLGDDPRNPRRLKTVRGMGYMLASELEP